MRITLATAALLFSIVVLGQVNPMEEGNYFISKYSRDFLNGRGANWTIAQDTNGIIMVGNHINGIALYDGKRVKQLKLKGVPYYSEARKIAMDKKGKLYVASDFNFGYLQKNVADQYEYISLSNSLPAKDKVTSRVWQLAIKNDTVFFQADSVIYKYFNNKCLKVWHFNPDVHIMHKAGNRIFIRQWGVGLKELIGDEFVMIKGSEFLAKNRVEAMYQLNNGSILLASRNIGFWLLQKDGTFKKTGTPQLDELIIKGEVYISNTVLQNGYIPVGTTKFGLLILDQNLNLIKIINTEVGLESNYVTEIFQDRNNDIWVSGRGASAITTDPSLTYYTTTNGLNGAVGGITRLNGRLYVKTSNDLFELVPPKNSFGSIHFNPQGVNEAGNDLTKFNDQLITTNNYNIKSSKNAKTSIIKTQYYTSASRQSLLNSTLLFSSAKGLTLHTYQNNQWKEIILSNNIKTFISNFVESEPGVLLLNTIEGPMAYQYNTSGIGTFHPLMANKKFGKSNLFRFFQTGTNQYHAIDSGFHIYTIDSKQFQLNYTGWSLDSLVKKSLFSITYNAESGYNWVKTLKGLFKVQIAPTQLPLVTQYPFEKVNMSELSNGFYAEGKDDNEIVWIGSQDDKLFRYVPSTAIKKKTTVYSALISAVYFRDSAIALNNQNIPFSKNQLSFEVSYPVFGNENKIQFSYWLEGQDNGWSTYTTDSKKEYTNLREGKYTLHVRAIDESLQVSKEATMRFTILPPWYRTWWAYLIYLIILGYGIYLFGKYQSKRSLDKAENERRSDELKAAKDFQQSMLPKTLPKRADLDIATLLRSSTEIGGDYYDFFEQQHGELFVVCGDATGHGIISGMMVSIAKAGLNGISSNSPNDILKQLNKVIKKVDLGTMRMSLNILKINHSSVSFSSAAMPPIYYYNAVEKKVEEIELSGLPLGGLREEYFDETERSFNTGDVIVLISDGLPEAPNNAGELFDYHRVHQVIEQFAAQNATEIKDQLINAVDTWLSGKNNPDDITIIVIKKSM